MRAVLRAARWRGDRIRNAVAVREIGRILCMNVYSPPIYRLESISSQPSAAALWLAPYTCYMVPASFVSTYYHWLFTD